MGCFIVVYRQRNLCAISSQKRRFLLKSTVTTQMSEDIVHSVNTWYHRIPRWSFVCTDRRINTVNNTVTSHLWKVWKSTKFVSFCSSFWSWTRAFRPERFSVTKDFPSRKYWPANVTTDRHLCGIMHGYELYSMGRGCTQQYLCRRNDDVSMGEWAFVL